MAHPEAVMWTRRGLLAAALAPAAPAGEDLAKRAMELRPADSRAAQEAVLDEIEGRARRALEAVRRARTAAAADAARGGLRRQLTQSLGLERLPAARALKAQTVGVVRRAGYRVEKVVWEALAGAKVPAHLYLPEAEGKRPAILFYIGHWWADSKMRPDFQAFSITAARLGFVVLTWDPFGQGERGVSQRDHRRTETLLVGVAQQGLAEFETQCALDYLLARPEVDDSRIGITGASGGGYNTWMTAALDDRIQAAVPVVGTSEFLRQIRQARTHDWYRANEHCHFVPGLIRFANNHELLAMIAPRPLLIINSEDDPGFAPEGAREVYEYGLGLYGSYGAREKVGFYVEPKSNHGYQKAKRERAYGWFLKWLAGRGEGEAVEEAPLEAEPVDSAEMRCFAAGRNEASGPAFVRWTKSQMAAMAPRRRAELPGVTFPRRTGPRPVRLGPAPERLERIEIAVGGGLRMPALRVKGAGRRRGTLVAADDRGKEAVWSDEIVREALDRGWDVVAVDPRGIGELANPKPNWAAAVSLLLNDSFPWRQALDLAAAVDAAPPGPVALYARGHEAGLAATLATHERRRRLRWFVLREGFLSLRQFVERESLAASFELKTEPGFRNAVFDREIPFAYFPFRALEYFDLPGLVAGVRGVVIDPIDGDWRRMAPEAARAWLAPGVTVGREELARLW